MKTLFNFVFSPIFPRLIGIFWILFSIYTILWIDLLDRYSFIAGVKFSSMKGYFLLIAISSAFVIFLMRRGKATVICTVFGLLSLPLIPFLFIGKGDKSYLSYFRDVAVAYTAQKVSRLGDTSIFGVFCYFPEIELLTTEFRIEIPEDLKIPDLPRYLDVYPISQPSNSIIVLCSKGGYPVIYRTDRFGLRNPDEVWLESESKKTIAILGDRFAFGDCVEDGNTFVDIIRSKISEDFRLINLAGRDDNILSAMVKFAELGKIVNPDIVLLVFSNYGFSELEKVWGNYTVRLYATKEGFSQRVSDVRIKSIVDNEMKKDLENKSNVLIEEFFGSARRRKKNWKERMAEKYENIFNSSTIVKVLQRRDKFEGEDLVFLKIAMEKMIQMGKGSAFIFVYVEIPGEESLFHKVHHLLIDKGIGLFKLKVGEGLKEVYPQRLYIDSSGQEIMAKEIWKILKADIDKRNRIFRKGGRNYEQE